MTGTKKTLSTRQPATPEELGIMRAYEGKPMSNGQIILSAINEIRKCMVGTGKWFHFQRGNRI